MNSNEVKHKLELAKNNLKVVKEMLEYDYQALSLISHLDFINLYEAIEQTELFIKKFKKVF